MYALGYLRQASTRSAPRKTLTSSSASSRRAASAGASARSSVTSSVQVAHGNVPFLMKLAQGSRQVTRSILERSSWQLRAYTTPAPINEAPAAASESFVSSALQVKAPITQDGVLGVNDGFAHLIDPGAWVSGWDPLFYTFQGSLELVHTLCGLPWWASVIAFAAAIRVLVFPLLVKQNRLTALTQRIQPEIEAIRLKYMYSPAGGDRKERFAHAAKMSEESRAVMRKHGISPFSAFKFTIPQAFATIGTFFVLRSISADPTTFLYPSWVDGGALWFQNLTAADPTYILPVLSTVTTMSIVLLTPIPNLSKRTVILGASGLGLLSLFFTAGFPAIVHLFWTGTSAFTAASTLLLKSSFMKNLVKIPSSDPSVSDAPPQVLYDAPPQMRPKVERVAVKPQTDASGSTSATNTASKKKTKQ